MDFLHQCHTRDAKKITALKPKKGQWAQLKSEYGDVWHEIESTYLVSPRDTYFSFTSSVLYLYGHRKNQRPIESFFLYRIRKVVKTLPKDASVIICKEGYFSDKNGNMDALPERVWK